MSLNYHVTVQNIFSEYKSYKYSFIKSASLLKVAFDLNEFQECQLSVQITISSIFDTIIMISI